MTWLSQQYDGLVTRFLLAEHGGSPLDWVQARRSGRWQPVSGRVLRSTATPATEAQWVLAGVLDASPGALLHGPSALGWLDLSGYSFRDLKVVRQNGFTGRGATIAHVHRLRNLRPHDVIVVRGVPTETALRAIWSEAARYSAERRRALGIERIGNLLDQAHRKGLVTWAALHDSLDDLQRRGRAGTVIMRALAADRPPGSSPTESRLERRFEEVVEQANLAPFRRQIWVGGHEPLGRADFRDHHLPLAVEVNSLAFHTTPSDRAADERRYRAMVAAGFTVGVVWEADLWQHPGNAVATVHGVRRAATRGHRVVMHSPSCPWRDPYAGAVA
ncbi:MAG: hypothetical protein KDB35_00940 [Acidimicrobiales bacterium]|nr:hypothetical protein [Acidimicrobiales bacterium]MCB1016533.1 hypothetical protein [Acidimicrobiales bacterium]